jgi:hypothetical protein
MTLPNRRIAGEVALSHQSKKTVLTAPLGESCLATTSPGPALWGPHAKGVGGAEPRAEHL